MRVTQEELTHIFDQVMASDAETIEQLLDVLDELMAGGSPEITAYAGLAAAISKSHPRNVNSLALSLLYRLHQCRRNHGKTT